MIWHSVQFLQKKLSIWSLNKFYLQIISSMLQLFRFKYTKKTQNTLLCPFDIIGVFTNHHKQKQINKQCKQTIFFFTSSCNFQSFRSSCIDPKGFKILDHGVSKCDIWSVVKTKCRKIDYWPLMLVYYCQRFIKLQDALLANSGPVGKTDFMLSWQI